MSAEDVTVMFAKAPEPGRVKTRLAASIGDRQAADFHAAFIDDLAGMLATLPGRRVVARSGSADHPIFVELRAAGFDLLDQGSGGLGQRLTRVVRQCVEEGAQRVVVLGSDSPTLQRTHLEQAFASLESHDVVLGPSFDGGYYLIGLNASWVRQFYEAQLLPVFRDVSWSTPDVLGQTLRRCREVGALCDLLGFWYDVDTIEDLQFLKIHVLEFLCHSAPDTTPGTLQRLRELEASGDFTSD